MGNNRKLPSTSTLLYSLLVALVAIGVTFGFGTALAEQLPPQPTPQFICALPLYHPSKCRETDQNPFPSFPAGHERFFRD